MTIAITQQNVQQIFELKRRGMKITEENINKFIIKPSLFSYFEKEEKELKQLEKAKNDLFWLYHHEDKSYKDYESDNNL